MKPPDADSPIEPPHAGRKRKVLSGCVWASGLLLLLFGIFIGNALHARYGREWERRTHRWGEWIESAVLEHRSDHKRLPMPASGVTSRDCDTDTSAAERLIDILAGNDITPDAKGTAYLGPYVNSESLRGLVKEPNGYAYYDWWGHHYRVRLDGDGDGFIPDPERIGNRLPGPLIIWSAGRDGELNTWGSWHEYSDRDFRRIK